MPSQYELFQQMEQVLDLLIDNAKQLSDAAMQTTTGVALEPLQLRQHEILHELSLLDSLMRKSEAGSGDEELDRRRARVREKLIQFQSINKEYINRITDRFRVIEKRELEPETKERLEE